MQKFKFFRTADIFLFLILLALPLLAIIRRTDFLPGKPVAVVEISGKTSYSLPLDKEQQISLREWNPPVVLQIEPGKIRILENDCIKQICVRTGYIDKTNESIVCVPKKLLIYIRSNNGSNQSEEIKAITG